MRTYRDKRIGDRMTTARAGVGSACLDCGATVDGTGQRCSGCRIHAADLHSPRLSGTHIGGDGHVRAEWCHGAGPQGSDHQRIPIATRRAALESLIYGLARSVLLIGLD